jgi:phosphoglycerate kinase
MNKMTIRDTDVTGRRVLVRVDYNVPLDAQGAITDDKRIAASLPTINALLDQGAAAVILMSHLGRPKGGPDPAFTLRPAAERLAELLGRPVSFAADCIGDLAREAGAAMPSGGVLLLENLRFHSEEEANETEFARQLASLGDIYVNDAFGSAHRAHASTEGVTRFIAPSVAGLLMEKELEYLGRAVEVPTRPYTAILGGAKISGKIDVIQHLIDRVDTLLVGGGMMFTFLKARGLEVGTSLVEADRIELATTILNDAETKGKRLILPVDTVVARDFSNDAEATVVGVDAIPADMMGLDIGPATIAAFSEVVMSSKTVMWNGPMGVFEMPKFAEGTFAIARAMAEATKTGSVTIVGGGDSASAIKKAGLSMAVSHVSTGGGASLEYLEGKVLPGVAALTDRA